MIALLSLTAGVTLAAVTLTFGIARLRRRYDTIDTFWGLGFALVAVVSFPFGTGPLALRLTTAALTVIWGVRLAVHLHLRNRDKPEDPRYQQIVERAGQNPGVRIFVRTYLMQAVVLWFVSLPVQFAMSGTGFGVTAWLGVAVWLLGFAFETIGDEQLRRFRANPANQGEVLDTGLWRYTRHPNYFGDACVWWGIWLVAASAWPGVLTVPSPVVMTYFLVFATGARLLEETMMKRPGYPEYAARTSMFVPLPPKRRP